MNLIPMKINDGAERDSIGSLYAGGSCVRYGLDGMTPNKDLSIVCSPGWKKYLVRELSKVEGGMDGLVRTDHGYTNQILERKVD